MAWADTIVLQEQVTEAIAAEYATRVHGVPLVHDIAQRFAVAAVAAVAEPAIRAQERDRLARLTDQREQSLVRQVAPIMERMDRAKARLAVGGVVVAASQIGLLHGGSNQDRPQ